MCISKICYFKSKGNLWGRNNLTLSWINHRGRNPTCFGNQMLLTVHVHGHRKYHWGQPRCPRRLADELKKSPIRIKVRTRIHYSEQLATRVYTIFFFRSRQLCSEQYESCWAIFELISRCQSDDQLVEGLDKNKVKSDTRLQEDRLLGWKMKLLRIGRLGVTRNFCFDFCDYQWFEGRVICLRLNENLLVFFSFLKLLILLL